MPYISIPESLRERSGEDASESLVEMLNEFEKENSQSIIEITEKRFEKKLMEEISNLGERLIKSDLSIKEELLKNDNSIKEELKQSISSIREEMIRGKESIRTEMHKINSTTIKWMFLFWVGQIGVLLGILFAFFK
ncbi:MAG: hypothetical protein DRP87_16450 [Spirochaetes bacterium]|nr:MAG: hypothetical protein DRP87_16450 [Spirochaetota bacterium]